MKKKSCLVLGGGSGQLSLIRRLKEKGIRIVLQDRNVNCSARFMADEFVAADTCNSEAAVESARRFMVDSVLTAGTDQPVLAAARAAEARGCPTLISPETALAVTDKEVMKPLLEKACIKTPGFRFAGPGDSVEVLKGLKTPMVLKPVDSQGQRGVVKLETSDDFLKYRDASLKWSRRGRLIVEEYHPNREITVSGWVYHGETSIWAVTDRVTRNFFPHIGLCMAHRYPSAYAASHRNEIRELTRKCVKALGIENGPLYFQYLITDSEILVNETAARLGGAYEDISLPPVCGTDLIEILICGAKKGYADPEKSEYGFPVGAASFAVPLIFCRPGEIVSTAEERSVRNFPGVTSFRYLLANGTVIGPPTNSVQRAAYMVIHGDSPAEVNRILRRTWPRISLKDREGRQLIRNTLGYALNPDRELTDELK